MVDQETLRWRLAILQDALADLRRYRAKYDATALRDDRDVQHMVLHALYIAAQAAIDIALHATANAEQPTSPTYQQAFANLAATGRLDAALAKRLMAWAGLRNVLAHHYTRIDFTLIARTLAMDLGELEQLAAIVSQWT